MQNSNDTTIQCRTTATANEVDATEDVIVFLQTFEEAVCTVNPCTYNWILTGLANVTGYSADFNTNLNDYVLTITGTGFNSTLGDATEILIDNFVQPIISASDTQV